MAAIGEEWATKAKLTLKAELKRDDADYAELARRLTEMSLPETEGLITAKINRGGFPAWFFLTALKAVGVGEVRLDR